MSFFFGATEFYLFDAAYLSHLLTGRYTSETAVLTAYMLIKYPGAFDFEGMPELEKKLNEIKVSYTEFTEFDVLRDMIDLWPAK